MADLAKLARKMESPSQNLPTPDIEPADAAGVLQSDLSRRAVSLGRYLDRLPEGDYMLVFHKAAQQWRVSVLETETLRSMELFR